MSSRILNYSMKQILYYFHFDGNYYAGDHIDIHNNQSVNIYEGQQPPTSSSNTCVEDVTPIEPHEPCPFLVPEKLTELGLYTLDQFETMFRKAAEDDAKTLAAFLKKFRKLGVLDLHGYSKKQIFNRIKVYFPSMRRYGYDNFVAYF